LLNKKEVKLDGIDIFNEKECYVIKADKSTLYYDVKTGLKIAESKTMEVEGQQLSQSTTFSDYRNVKGIQIPFVTNINIGMEILLTITDVKINEGVYDADFE